MLASLYLVTNSSAPLKATWLIYLSTSSDDIPIPLSIMVNVFSLASKITSTLRLPISPFTSPFELNVFNFWEASTALLTNSRKNISWSL